MSFNHLSYDGCAYGAELAQNMSSLSYLLDPIKYEHCNKCRNELGLVGGTAVGVPNGNMIAVENSLHLRDTGASRCPSMKYLPTSDNKIQGKDNYKTDTFQSTDITQKQLPSCMHNDYSSVPWPEPIDQFKCSTDSPRQKSMGHSQTQ